MHVPCSASADSSFDESTRKFLHPVFARLFICPRRQHALGRFHIEMPLPRRRIGRKSPGFLAYNPGWQVYTRSMQRHRAVCTGVDKPVRCEFPGDRKKAQAAINPIGMP